MKNLGWQDKTAHTRRDANHFIVQDYSKKRLDLILRYVRPNTKCIELGAGDGFFSVQLEKEFDLLVSDKSEALLHKNLSQQKKISLDAKKTNFNDLDFNICFEANMLHHAENEKKIALEMMRISSDYVVAIEPNPLNPLNFILGLVLKHERKSLKFTQHYVKQLFNNKDFKTLKACSFGVIPPNSCPVWFWRLFKFFEREIPILGIDNIYIFKRT